VENLDRQVLARLAQDRLLLLLDDLTRTMVRVDDVVPDLVDDQLDFASDLKIFDGFFSSDVGRQGVLLAHAWWWAGFRPLVLQVCR